MSTREQLLPAGGRRWLPLSVILALGLALGACGGGEQTSSESESREEVAGVENKETGGGTGGSAGSESFALPGEGVFPEGIGVDKSNGDFYVGSTRDGTRSTAATLTLPARQRCSWREVPMAVTRQPV